VQAEDLSDVGLGGSVLPVIGETASSREDGVKQIEPRGRNRLRSLLFEFLIIGSNIPKSAPPTRHRTKVNPLSVKQDRVHTREDVHIAHHPRPRPLSGKNIGKPMCLPREVVASGLAQLVWAGPWASFRSVSAISSASDWLDLIPIGQRARARLLCWLCCGLLQA
jgi:hypothetical protein